MKMFYTKQELGKLSESEVAELTGFEGGDNYYFYSDLEKLGNEDGEYSFHFKDGSVIYTQSEDTYDKVKNGRARYTLLMSSLQEKEKEEKNKTDFYEMITAMVRDELSHVHDSVSTFRANADLAVTKVQTDSLKALKAIEKTSDDSHSQITKKVSDAAKKWDNKLNSLDAFDTKAYNIKMEKMDKLLDMFEKLMVD